MVTLIVSDVFMDKLSEKQQEIIREAAAKAQQDSYEISDQKKEEARVFLEGEGMKIVTPSEKEFEELKELSQPVWDSVKEQCGDELFDAYTKIAEEK